MADATTLIRRALDCGIELQFVDGVLRVTGKRSAVTTWAPKLREHKAELIQRLQESSLLTVQLLEAAMRRCDQFKDCDKARQDMREQVMETPHHLRQDLLNYFNGAPPPCGG